MEGWRMRAKYREILFASIVAGSLSLSLIAGAFADRGDGHGAQNHGQQQVSVTSHGSGRSSDGKGQSKHQQDDVNDELTTTPTGTITPGTATPSAVEDEFRNH